MTLKVLDFKGHPFCLDYAGWGIIGGNVDKNSINGKSKDILARRLYIS